MNKIKATLLATKMLKPFSSWEIVIARKGVTATITRTITLATLLLTAFSCSNGRIVIEDKAGTIESWPGMGWISFMLFVLLVATIVGVYFLYDHINQYKKLTVDITQSLPVTINRMNALLSKADKYEAVNNELLESVLSKEKEITKLETELTMEKRNVVREHEIGKDEVEKTIARLKAEIAIEKNNVLQEREISKTQIEKEQLILKHSIDQMLQKHHDEKEKLEGELKQAKEEVSQLLSQKELFNYVLTKYKIDLFANNDSNFDIQLKVWEDKLIRYHNVGSILEDMTMDSRIPAHHQHDLKLLKTRISKLETSIRRGTINEHEPKASTERNTIMNSIIELITALRTNSLG